MNRNRFALNNTIAIAKNIVAADAKVRFAAALLALACVMVVTAMTQVITTGQAKNAGLLTSTTPVVVTR